MRGLYSRGRAFGGARETLAGLRAFGRSQGIAYVRAHKRTRTYAERKMFRRAIAEKADYFAEAALRNAISDVNNGIDPSATSIQGRM